MRAKNPCRSLIFFAAALASATARAAAGDGAGNDGAGGRTVDRYGDWSVICAGPTASAPRTCEADMTLHDRQGQPVALIAVGRPRPDAPLKIAIQVPANTKVNHAMRLGTDSVDELVLPFTRCNQGGCLAEFDFYDDGVLRLLRAHPAGRPGRIAWQDFAGAPVVMEFPMRGFAALVDALRRDPR